MGTLKFVIKVVFAVIFSIGIVYAGDIEQILLEDSNIIIDDNNDAEVMRVQSDGLVVGIDTNTPHEKLEVSAVYE